MSSTKVAQLCNWLDSYLAIARAVLSKPASTDLPLYFVTSPPTIITIHCTTANYKTVGLLDGEFYYNGPAVTNSSSMLYYFKNNTLTPVIRYEDFFDATLISINTEYEVGGQSKVRAKEVVTVEYVPKHGTEMEGPLTMPQNYVPRDTNELVPKSYVDKLRLDLELRIGKLEKANP